ncbi:MAG: hypothetical protein JWM75_1464 [Sphingomonas bacterium]|nr:hypothetical protein [Sphingomonas bacterium]
MRMKFVAAAAVLAISTTGMAQVPNPSPTRELPHDRGYDKDSPKHDAIDAQEAPVTRDLNATSALGAQVKTEATTADEAQYQADLDAYRADVRANARETARDENRYARQQRAYADAMAVWRGQVAACDRGKLSACKLPTPNPRDFY